MAAAITTPFVSVEEYLHSVYEPDVDYVDGELEDRNVGEFDHAMLQRALLFALARTETQSGYLAIQELRVQTSPTRFRVPDICLLPADRLPKRIVNDPPLLCIEVLSPEDRFSRTQRKCNDYLQMGVPEVWIFDAQERRVTVMRKDSTVHVTGGTLRVEGTTIKLSIDELFAV